MCPNKSAARTGENPALRGHLGSFLPALEEYISDDIHAFHSLSHNVVVLLAFAKTVLALMAPEVAATVFTVTIFTRTLMKTTAAFTLVTLSEAGGRCNHQGNKHSKRQN